MKIILVTELTLDFWNALIDFPSKESLFRIGTKHGNPIPWLYAFKEITGEISLLGYTERLPTKNDVSFLGIDFKVLNNYSTPDINGAFYKIQLRSTNDIKLFSLLVAEIAHFHINAGKTDIIDAEWVIIQWADFWRKIPLATLTREKQLGLYGELFIIFDLLVKIDRKRIFNLIDGWQGPLNAAVDFSWGDTFLEVKAAMNKQNYTIHGLDQLETHPTKFKALAALTVAEVDNGLTINDLYRKIVNQLLHSKRTYSMFVDKFIKAGGNPIVDDGLIKFEKIHSAFYNIDANFPRLTRSMLNSPISIRISRVQYSVDLDGLQTNLIGIESVIERI